MQLLSINFYLILTINQKSRLIMNTIILKTRTNQQATLDVTISKSKLPYFRPTKQSFNFWRDRSNQSLDAFSTELINNRIQGVSESGENMKQLRIGFLFATIINSEPKIHVNIKWFAFHFAPIAWAYEINTLKPWWVSTN